VASLVQEPPGLSSKPVGTSRLLPIIRTRCVH
jgi:hypothetical protein